MLTTAAPSLVTAEQLVELGNDVPLGEPLALDDLAGNLSLPGAGLNYAASAFLCVSSSLSRHRQPR